jgi:2-polyprenyl-3-methyl-5-hydroxy-6-metoxy-1,4-benzoquinol methylase
MRDDKQSVKEIIRHTLHVLGISKLLYFVRRVRGQKNLDLNVPRDLESAFEDIYKGDIWLVPDGESRSGDGSDLAATLRVVEPLQKVLGELQCKCLVDIGCGDFNWMRHVVANATFRYVGCDIAKIVVEENRKKYQNELVGFQHLNACEQPVPAGDVVICREVLFHLSFEDIARVIENVRSSSSAKYFLTTLDRSIWFNSNITSGDFRNINLLIRPFRLPEPIMTIADDGIRPGRVLAVWRTDQLPSLSQQANKRELSMKERLDRPA